MSYTVQQREGCTLITGSVPITQLTALMSAAGKGAVVSDNLARLAGVQFAWGLPADVDALEDKLRAGKLAGLIAGQADPSADGLSDAARQWLAVGEHGLSSCAMFWKLTGVKPSYIADQNHYDYPHGAGDLRQCMMLLDQVPELKGRIHQMAECSRSWAALVSHWDDLCATLAEEAPDWASPKCSGKAQQTYDKIMAILPPLRGAES